MDAPRHAFELKVQIGGETWPDVIRELNRLTVHIEEHGIECNMVSGGAGTASMVTIEKREVEPERYRKELMEWMEKQRRKEPVKYLG